jgi:hypothetical protein
MGATNFLIPWFWKGVVLMAMANMPAQGGATPQAPLPSPFAGLILVQAKVIEVKLQEKGDMIPSTQEIVHVYCGPGELVGKTFADSSSRSGQDSIGTTATPPLQKGEIGIWSLKESPEGLFVKRYPHLGFSYRARALSTPGYGQIQALAEGIERVCKAKPAERVSVLRKLALSPSPQLSAWALHVLAEAKPEGLEKMLDELLTDEKLSVTAQIALDEILSATRGARWQKSERRRKFLDKWVSTRHDEQDAEHIFTRLATVGRQGELSDRNLLQLLVTAASNEEMSRAARQQALFVIGTIAGRGQDEGLAFAFLTKEIQGAKEQELRMAAAYALKNLVPLDKDKAAVIRALKENVQDAKLLAVLQEALNGSP